jgi:hypothetical protein
MLLVPPIGGYGHIRVYIRIIGGISPYKVATIVGVYIIIRAK